MESKDLKEVFRILKKKNILAQEVAEAMALTVGHLSKVKNGKKGLTPENRDGFNAKFGHLVRIHSDLVKQVPDPRTLESIVNADHKTIEALLTTVRALRGLLLEHHEKLYKVDHITARQVMGNKLVDEQAKNRGKDILTDLDSSGM